MEGRLNYPDPHFFAAGANLIDEVTADNLNSSVLIAFDANQMFSKTWEIGGIAKGKVMCDAGSVVFRIDSFTDDGGSDIASRTIVVCENGVTGTRQFLCGPFIPFATT